MPLTTELLPRVLAELERVQGGETHAHRARDEYLTYIEATTGTSPDPIDIEDFVTYLDHEHYFGLLTAERNYAVRIVMQRSLHSGSK